MLAAIWLPEGWKQLPTDPTPSYWYPVTFAFEACEDNTTSPVVSSATRDRRAFSQGVGVPPPFSLYIFTYISIYIHLTGN